MGKKNMMEEVPQNQSVTSERLSVIAPAAGVTLPLWVSVFNEVLQTFITVVSAILVCRELWVKIIKPYLESRKKDKQ